MIRKLLSALGNKTVPATFATVVFTVAGATPANKSNFTYFNGSVDVVTSKAFNAWGTGGSTWAALFATINAVSACPYTIAIVGTTVTVTAKVAGSATNGRYIKYTDFGVTPLTQETLAGGTP